VTRYDFFRKRIAPILFLGMVGVIAYDACSKEERTHATIVLDLGEATGDVRSVDAELLTAGGESLSVFHRAALPGGSIGPVRFDAALPDEVAQIRIDVALRDKMRTITKTLRPVEGSTVTVLLGPSLQ
jgi:hypothetical protein